jgi:mannonate dehydratase
MGKDVFAMIRDFGGRGKLFDIDFRNVNTTLPVFHETLPDDGYLDMYKVMRALREVRYAGGLVPDHLPEMAGDGPEKRAALAYAIAYLRALLKRANEEVG